jgi:superfamily I DNA/RNA helicase
MFGYTKAPQIVDTNDVVKKRLFNNILVGDDLYTMQNRFNLLDWAIKVHEIIKANSIDPDSEAAIDAVYKQIGSVTNSRFMSYQDVENLVRVAKEFDSQLKENNLLTFADVEPMMNKVLKENPDYLNSLGIKHVLVDEFQDSNDAQMETIKLLISADGFESLMVVGDDSQSIYGFRNTSQENILHFFDKLGITGTDFRLDENRRSTEEILAFANRIDALNENRVGGDMVAVRGGGFKPVVRAYWSRDEEYDFIVDQIGKGIASGKYTPEEFAVIAYKKSELVAIAGKLSQAGIPWITKYPMPLQDNSRVQAAISLASAFYQPEAETLYFNYLVALNDGDIFADMTNDEIKAKVAELKKEWMGMDMLEIPYQRKLFHDKLEAIKGNDEIYAAFLELLYENEDLQSELEFIMDFRRFGETVAKKLENDYAGVVLTTAHSSKGLEWPVVFNTISGYDNKFLHAGGKKTAEDIEERRRLLYVSVTRARDILYVTGQYVAYGNYMDYAYNQFLREAIECSGREYRPVKPVKSGKTGTAGKNAKEMTEKQKAEYDKLARHAVQMSITDMVG